MSTVLVLVEHDGQTPRKSSLELLTLARRLGEPAAVVGGDAGPELVEVLGEYGATTVYPVPVPGGLGVHITLDLARQARFGPDVEWISAVDYTVDPTRGEVFYAAIRTYWPGLPDGALQPGYAGIRPKISGPGEPAADFVVQGPDAHSVPGLVNLYGIESPGLTASLPLADEVVRKLRFAES